MLRFATPYPRRSFRLFSGTPGGRGAQVDAPSDLVAWVRSLGITASAQAELLQRLTGDSFGATGVEDLRELEPDGIDTLKATLPMLRRKAFVEAIAALRNSEFSAS